MGEYENQKLLIVNRGEIAVRIIRTAKKLGLRTLAIYTPSDSLSPHVALADEAVPLPLIDGAGSAGESEAKAYLSSVNILTICRENSVTLVHPGYGFISENAEFASLVSAAGMTWLGPKADVIRVMGIKHEARKVAVRAGLKVVPGSEGLVQNAEDAIQVAKHIGFPVILKATAGGGGMGMVICNSEADINAKFVGTRDRAKVLFGEDGVFLEKYFPVSRHIEIQVFGNGLGEVVHMGERECSIQRRHQKLIEETPSPFASSRDGLRERMCKSATDLCRSLHYSSAGTVEFLVDDKTGDFYFLEMNTRIQVEHPITEAVYPGLDLVQLMIQQGMAEHIGNGGIPSSSKQMQQETYNTMHAEIHAIEGRIYAENPAEGFVPCPGLLQNVELNEGNHDWLRIDSWISTGLNVTPFFDPLLCKIVVTGRFRSEAISRFIEAVNECKILGPPNNAEYLQAIANSEKFRSGHATTNYLESFKFSPRAFKVLSSGIDSSIQDLPGRKIGLGIPRSGPMDSLAFSAGNIIVGNPATMEGLEIVVVPGVECALQVFVASVYCVTGKEVNVKVNDTIVEMWSRFVVPAGGMLTLEAGEEKSSGFRVYLSVRGGFPEVPSYLGSKSTSMGLGGYQGRSLLPGDQIALGDCEPKEPEVVNIPKHLRPVYPHHWVIYVLAGPQGDEEFITSEGVEKFYATHWRVSSSSNRLGIRLESSEKIQWARENGGEGGSHPSNILDNGYAPGTINVNGDTPVILTNEGPDMGGYLCLCTVATGDMWKLGQLSPGCTVEFRRLPWTRSKGLSMDSTRWLSAMRNIVTGAHDQTVEGPYKADIPDDKIQSPLLHAKASKDDEGKVTFRQAGDSAILVEFGSMKLDLFIRARIHAFQGIVTHKNVPGILNLCPCIRSVMCFFDMNLITQSEVLKCLIEAENEIPEAIENMEFPGRKITFPIVLDDSWNREALERYMRTIRSKAVYLPSNIDYLANNNGVTGGSQEALQKLVDSDWLVLGVGFYLACPFLVPIDPRCRLIGQKMNPSRTFTPRGAIGIAGPVAAIYPIESPGGYQLYGRTLPAWQTWGKGSDFRPDRPWLLQPFDQIHFEPIAEADYINLEKQFDAGQYTFKIEPAVFSMAEHSIFLESIKDEIAVFRERQREGSRREEIREQLLLQEWADERQAGRHEAPSDAAPAASEGKSRITASLFASVWKINVKPGDVIKSAEEVVVVLEAMKTEIPVRAGVRNVGLAVKSCVKEGGRVRPGDVLVVLG